MATRAKKTVAIACQGGGSHAAFAAGVLQRLLAPDLRERYELVGLSGTSGGAICAALAWAGLQAGGPEEAIARLGAFWDDVKASNPIDAFIDQWSVAALRAPITAAVSPYAYRPLAQEHLAALIARHVRLAELPEAERARFPVKLLVGATDVLLGERVIFAGTALTDRHLLASAAVPPLFRAVDIDGHVYWDGLFTSNPPVREFTQAQEDGNGVMAVKPEEIWIVQINPQTQREEPRTQRAIDDRRNELSGNLALAQELHLIDTINTLTQRMHTEHPRVPWPYQRIQVRIVEMPIPGLDYASKLDRSPAFIDRLVAAGMEQAPRLLEDAEWPGSGSIPKGSRKVR